MVGKICVNDNTKSPLLVSMGDFRRDFLDDDIFTLDFNSGTFLPTLMKELASSRSTYGVLIQNGDFVVNPLHPINAFLISIGKLKLPDHGKIHIFNFKESVLSKKVTKKADKTYRDFYATIFDTFEYLSKEKGIRSSKAFIDESNQTKISEMPFMDELNVKIKSEITEETSDTSGTNSLIIPLQMTAASILVPYYGTAYITYPKSGAVGYNLTPMLSGNIYTPRFESSWKFYQESDGNEDDFSVCTGSYSNDTKAGWLTLSRVTLNSMYFEEIIGSKEVFPFVTVSKGVAADLWAIIEEEELNKLQELKEAKDVKEKK
jgi:hypothetical protein